MKTFQYKSLQILLLTLTISLFSCKKLIEVDPPSTSVNQGNIYENEGTAISAVIGIYSSTTSNNLAGIISYYPELSADNLKILNLTNIQQLGYYQNNLLASDAGSVPKMWLLIYPRIFTCNGAIEGITSSGAITDNLRKNLLGQAYFLRAFYYFYLVNFYGDVPLALTTDYAINNILNKVSSNQVYDQIVSDLKQAQSMLPDGYLTGDMKTTFAAGQEQRVSANRAAASALLARVYLYRKQYSDAEAMATEVINMSGLYSAVALNQVFLKNSKETILALQPVAVGANSGEAEFYVLRGEDPAINSTRSAFLTTAFMDSFQTGDQRKNVWIASVTKNGTAYPYPAKYKALFNSAFTEQSILLRLGEQYLIRAEARIQQNKIGDGIADLNVLRDRATDKTEPDLSKRLKQLASSLTKDEALNALSYERRVELFAEAGHRWFDLKRTGQINAVMVPATALKGGSWSSYKAFYPIPSAELLDNTNLKQNDGYTN